jgi:hypothetical protein
MFRNVHNQTRYYRFLRPTQKNNLRRKDQGSLYLSLLEGEFVARVLSIASRMMEREIQREREHAIGQRRRAQTRSDETGSDRRQDDGGDNGGGCWLELAALRNVTSTNVFDSQVHAANKAANKDTKVASFQELSCESERQTQHTRNGDQTTHNTFPFPCPCTPRAVVVGVP